MTLNKSQLTALRIVIVLICLAVVAWVWRQSEKSQRPPTTAAWVENLQSGDANERKLAVQELSGANPDDAQTVVPALIGVLKNSDASARNEAGLALGTYLARAVKERGAALVEESRAAANALIDLIKTDHDTSVRASAAFALGGLHRAMTAAGVKPTPAPGADPLDPKNIARAFNSVLEADTGSRLAILVPYQSLGEIGEPAPAPLLAGLNDPSPDVRKLVLQVLSQFTSGSDEAVPVLLKDAEIKAPPSGIQAAKGSGPGSALGRAAESLHPTKAVVPILTKAIESQNPDVRRAAVVLLGRVGPDARSASQPLVAATEDLIRSNGAKAKDEGPQFSDYATTIAQVLPAEEAVSVLGQAVGQDHRPLRIAAATALGTLGANGQAAVPVLLKALKAVANPPSGQPESAYVGALIQSLGRIAPFASLPQPTVDEVVGAISGYLESAPNFVEIAAAKALGELGPKAAAALPKLHGLAENAKATPAAKEAAVSAIAQIQPEKKTGK
jgi:HEAT repeat protein